MVRRLFVVAILALVLDGVPARGQPSVLPDVSFQDQEGRHLELAALRGHVGVIVYGGRAAVEQHVAWGKQLDAEMRRSPPHSRPVQILALAQMGGIPQAFRPMLRRVIRPHVETGYSLWLDWDDQMRTLFGAHDPASTVVVADTRGAVRLVVSGPPQGEPYRAVCEELRRLR
jgi:hypothetical protein